jgi:hypothetical protein
MTPDSSVVTQNQDHIKFVISTGKTGFLVILEHGTQNELQLVYPPNREAASGFVQAGGITKIPANVPYFEAGEPGDEHIKAFLFESQAAAQSLLDLFPPPADNALAALPWAQWQNVAKSRRILPEVKAKPVPSGGIGFYTSDIHFYVQ